ncbi:MAG: HDOD domain-containing protein [Saccharospirillaceae bacterium]|nr:HDOD domain-containing protein [Pseudomonadales bacterium]NRB80889.1 HDOD domain-containing protein [Saccharospirillaceae bacterium]
MNNEYETPASINTFVTQHEVPLGGQMNNTQQLVKAEVVLLEDKQGVEDKQGAVQVFFASNSIFELSTLCQLLNRELVPLGNEKIEKIKGKYQIGEFPALDNYLDMQTYIDHRLLEVDDLYIYNGSRDQVVLLKDKAKLVCNDKSQIIDTCADIKFCLPGSDLSILESDHLAINNAVDLFTSKRIKQRIEETLEIPPLPETAQAIINLRMDPNADVNKLCKIVETDPSLAAQVVSWAGSSYYAAPGSVKSVQDAIVRVLGFELVMNLSLGLSLGKTLDLPKDGPEAVTPYWVQSVYCATSMGSLASIIPREFRPSFGLSYLSGLLHNFGYLILAHSFKPQFINSCRLIDCNAHLESYIVENHLMNVTREQMAHALMQAWHMPDEVCMALRHQNMPEYRGLHSDYAYMVYLTKQKLRQFGVINGPILPIDPAIYELLHVTEEAVDEVFETILESKEELDAIARGLGGGL